MGGRLLVMRGQVPQAPMGAGFGGGMGPCMGPVMGGACTSAWRVHWAREKWFQQWLLMELLLECGMFASFYWIPSLMVFFGFAIVVFYGGLNCIGWVFIVFSWVLQLLPC